MIACQSTLPPPQLAFQSTGSLVQGQFGKEESSLDLGSTNQKEIVVAVFPPDYTRLLQALLFTNSRVLFPQVLPAYLSALEKVQPPAPVQYWCVATATGKRGGPYISSDKTSVIITHLVSVPNFPKLRSVDWDTPTAHHQPAGVSSQRANCMCLAEHCKASLFTPGPTAWQDR